MIKRRTVFVLGAGASRSYGFLLGSELKTQVLMFLGQAEEHPYVATVRGAAEVSQQEIVAFRNDLADARRSSIDRFLQTRQNYLTIGKAAMAALLIPSESDAALRVYATGDWMSYLLDRMIGDQNPQSFRNNQLTVITFNFDRSFERMLFLALRSSYPLTDGEAAALAQHVRVFHVHGDLGLPRWLLRDGIEGWSRPYEPEVTPQIVREAAARIRLVHEEITDADLEPMRAVLRGADVICLLGCGFHRMNLARLRLDVALPNTEIRATTLGMTMAELTPADRFMRPNSVHKHDMDVLQFLRSTDIIHD